MLMLVESWFGLFCFISYFHSWYLYANILLEITLVLQFYSPPPLTGSLLPLTVSRGLILWDISVLFPSFVFKQKKLYFTTLEWWDVVRQDWALFVLLLSTLVCCQPTELIWNFSFIYFRAVVGGLFKGWLGLVLVFVFLSSGFCQVLALVAHVCCCLFFVFCLFGVSDYSVRG